MKRQPGAEAQVVQSAYDALAGRYGEWSARVTDAGRERFVPEFMERVPPGSAVLDIGCGAGVPGTRQLATRFEVTALDLSAVQLERARRDVPNATFIHGDVSTIEFPAASFGGAVALYAFNHVARDRHAAVCRRVNSWLRLGGYLLATFSADDSPDWIGEWLGQRMFFSGFSADVNREMLVTVGFELVADEVLEIEEPEGPVRFQWVLARRGEAGA